MSDIISIDVSALIQEITNDDSGYLSSYVADAVDERITEAVGDAVDDYLRYGSDIADIVSDCVTDYLSSSLGEELSSLLNDVGETNLCGLGSDFARAINTVLKHHVPWSQVIEDSELADIIKSNESTENIQKIVSDKFNKEMKVEVSFVDKEPPEVVGGSVI